MRDAMRHWFAPAEERDDPNLSGVLEEAAADGGCPVCRTRNRRVERHEFTILWEEVNDPGLRETLMASWGFSRQHAWQMASSHFMGVGAPFGLAIIYRDLVRRLAAALAAPGELAHALKPTRADPVVGSEREAVKDFTHILARRGNNQAFRARYARWNGACLPHGSAALPQAAPASARWLGEDLLRRLDERVAAATDPDGIGRLAALLVGDPPPAPRGGWTTHAGTLPDTLDLSALLALAGCPLCNAEAATARFMLVGLMTDRGDLCGDHAWRLVALARDQAIPVAQAATVLGGMANRWRVRVFGTLENNGGASPCPVCVAVHEAARTTGQLLLDQGGEASVQGALHRADGVCVPHLRGLLATHHPQIPALLAAERAVVERLLGELNEFIRKHDYRFASEAKGYEGTSWYRAIRLIAGNPPYDEAAHE